MASYGPDYVGPYRCAAAYLDRILKDEKPADLPVEAPTKFELVVTAKTLRPRVPSTLLARVTEEIE